MSGQHLGTVDHMDTKLYRQDRFVQVHQMHPESIRSCRRFSTRPCHLLERLGTHGLLGGVAIHIEPPSGLSHALVEPDLLSVGIDHVEVQVSSPCPPEPNGEDIGQWVWHREPGAATRHRCGTTQQCQAERLFNPTPQLRSRPVMGTCHFVIHIILPCPLLGAGPVVILARWSGVAGREAACR